ncbi:hypothetical protein [Pseudoalteromonas luteoviolacea]|uniref:Disulfide bond formation protein DsbB n=1 Tax=Pseudoalteromonas luteoviolacea H33 TaxID=1365251 RepID=A0A161Y9G5_9GAMM|nr:hypothetical protein [Pseudoalteromonas luteoviolacea]KZN52713.1 hypothetical protein N476_09780 [Pseudoalteromonas luteoviolacea H33]KZN73843.1 hypothetical protein N477_22755 [Pseudoalteromonas luteoviolacea H33-S]MBQ4880253.1 hypothetical protein [Pseudoalteromonas luteoviolacea]MBQ4909314.1 hypothetical protein [Pseudoalteromonas luteoviolacea]
MSLFQLETYIKYSKFVALVAILISITAWTVELTGIVYVCPYCRAQRTVIGILGLLLILPTASHWISKYIVLVIGFFGAVVAANQHFMGWKSISAGTFNFHEHIAMDPFLLSGFAMTGIIGLTFLNLKQAKTQQKPE